MTDKKETTIFLCLAAFIILILLRAYKVAEAGFFDYDSVMNFLAAKGISKEDYKMLFNHVCPSFNLFYAFLYKLYPDFIFLQYVNLSLNSVAIIFFVVLFAKYFNFSKWELVLIILLIGTSLFMVGSARYFSIDALSLLLVVLLFYCYYESIARQSKTYAYVSALLFIILFTVNYKSLLLMPILGLTEFIQQRRRLTSKDWLFMASIAATPILFFSVYGWIHGFSLLRYIAGITATFIRQKSEHEYVPIFSSDLFYYFKYLFFLENPLIVIVLVVFPILYRKKLFSNLRELNSYQFLFIIIYCMLAGMSLLAKAPRGIAFIYPLLYLFLYLCIRKILVKKYLSYIVTSFIIIYQFWLVKGAIYNYSQSSYNKVGAYLATNKISKVALTVGVNSLPYIEKAEAKVIFDEKELVDLKKQGYKFVVVDDFSKAANVNKFEKLYKEPTVACYKSPSMLSPLVFLEECEYTGLSFEQTMAVRQEAMKDTCQIRIVKLN